MINKPKQLSFSFMKEEKDLLTPEELKHSPEKFAKLCFDGSYKMQPYQEEIFKLLDNPDIIKPVWHKRKSGQYAYDGLKHEFNKYVSDYYACTSTSDCITYTTAG